MVAGQSRLIGPHLDNLDLWKIKDSALQWWVLQDGYHEMVVMANLFEHANIRIGETAPYLYAPLLKNWIVAFTPNLWHAVERQLGQLETRCSSTWRVGMSLAFWSMKMTRIDKEEFTETVTLSPEDLEPLGGIRVHNLQSGQIAFTPPSIHHRRHQYLEDDFKLAFQVLEEARDVPRGRKAVQGGNHFKYSNVRVNGYIPIPEEMMESVKDNLRWLPDVRHVPWHVVQMIYNLLPGDGTDHVPGMIVPPKTPRDDDKKETSAERNERRKRSKKNRAGKTLNLRLSSIPNPQSGRGNIQIYLEPLQGLGWVTSLPPTPLSLDSIKS